jgi:hypothetical protein
MANLGTGVRKAVARRRGEIRFSSVLPVSFGGEGHYGRHCLRKLSVTQLPWMLPRRFQGRSQQGRQASRWCQRGIRQLGAGAVDAVAETYGCSDVVGSDRPTHLSRQGLSGAVCGLLGRGRHLAAGRRGESTGRPAFDTLRRDVAPVVGAAGRPAGCGGRAGPGSPGCSAPDVGRPGGATRGSVAGIATRQRGGHPGLSLCRVAGKAPGGRAVRTSRRPGVAERPARSSPGDLPGSEASP